MIDFEDIVANCEELLELSTSMCVRLAGNDFNQEVIYKPRIWKSLSEFNFKEIKNIILELQFSVYNSNFSFSSYYIQKLNIIDRITAGDAYLRDN